MYFLRTLEIRGSDPRAVMKKRRSALRRSRIVISDLSSSLLDALLQISNIASYARIASVIYKLRLNDKQEVNYDCKFNIEYRASSFKNSRNFIIF